MLVGNKLDDVISNFKDTIPESHAKKILTVSQDKQISDSVQSAVEEAIKKNGYKRVIGLSSSYGKDVIPRIAGKF